MMMLYNNRFLKKLADVADNKILQLSLFVIFFIILEIEYFHFINIPLFQEKNGFDFEFSWMRLIIVQLLFSFVLYLLTLFRNFDYFVNSLFFIFLTIPAFVLYEFMPNTPFIISVFMVIFHVLYYFSTKIEIDMGRIKGQINDKYILWYLFGIAFVLLIPFIIDFGLAIRFDAFTYKGMYAVRENGTSNLTFITAYLYGWLVRIIIPIVFIMALSKRNWLVVFVIIIAQTYLYSLLAQKLVFVTLFVALIMYIRSFNRQIVWITFSLIGLILVTKFISLASGNIFPESIIVRRTFFVPAIITNYYFDFFQSQPIYYSNSILKHIFDYPFDLAPNLLIGQEYFPNSIKSANSGFISDGFMNLGYFGVILNIIGVITVFKLFSIIKISAKYSGVFIIIIYTLVNGYFLTSMLTHGIIIMLIISFFMLRNSQQQTNN